jgi:hypothetical protein
MRIVNPIHIYKIGRASSNYDWLFTSWHDQFGRCWTNDETRKQKRLGTRSTSTTESDPRKLVRKKTKWSNSKKYIYSYPVYLTLVDDDESIIGTASFVDKNPTEPQPTTLSSASSVVGNKVINPTRRAGEQPASVKSTYHGSKGYSSTFCIFEYSYLIFVSVLQSFIIH